MTSRNGHADIEELLLKLTAFGQYVHTAMAEAAEDEEIVGNLPILVLATLDLHGPQRPGDLQDRTGLSSGGVTKLVDRLEEKRLVERSYGAIPEDHRGVLVSLTDLGRSRIRAMVDTLGHHLPETATLVKEIDRLLQR